MKRSVVLLCALSALTIGCGGPMTYSADAPGQSASWELALVAWEMRDEVRTSPNTTLEPRAGNVWLLIHTRMSNLTDERRTLNWNRFDHLYFVSVDGTKHPIGYTNPFSSFAEYLPPLFNPHETRSGFVMFEVPPTVDVSKGKILFQPHGGRPLYFDLTDLPHI